MKSEEEKNKELIDTINLWIAKDKKKEKIYKHLAIIFFLINFSFYYTVFVSFIILIFSFTFLILYFKIKKDIKFHLIMKECEL